MPAIDPSFLTSGWASGPEFEVAPPDLAAEAPELASGTPAAESFGSVLGKQIAGLSDLQSDAASASQALATGTASDPASVVMAVERARLSMQLASQLRTKGVEAVNEIFRTQV